MSTLTRQRRKSRAARRGPLSRQERRLYESIPREIDYVHDPSFDERSTERQLWGPDRKRIEVAPYPLYREIVERGRPARRQRNPLSRQDEQTLFLRYNYAKYRLAKLRGRAGRPTTSRARRMIQWFRRAQATRTKLAHANMALVPAMMVRAGVGGVEAGELISEGFLAVLRSMEKFDASRGYKFSTYACQAILKSFLRQAVKDHRYHQRFGTEFEPTLEQSDEGERRHESQRDRAIDIVREAIRKNRAHLTALERQILMARFALLTDEGPKTLAQVGRAVGLSNERVRQIEKRSLHKLREALKGSFAA